MSSDPTDAVPGGGYPGMPHMDMTVPEGTAIALAEGEKLTEAHILRALEPVKDPEIHLSVVALGLIYGVDVEEDGRKVVVRMTLTGPGCPVGPQILAAVHATVARQPGVTSTDVQLVWDPPWNPVVHASDEAKDVLGIW